MKLGMIGYLLNWYLEGLKRRLDLEPSEKHYVHFVERKGLDRDFAQKSVLTELERIERPILPVDSSRHNFRASTYGHDQIIGNSILEGLFDKVEIESIAQLKEIGLISNHRIREIPTPHHLFHGREETPDFELPPF